MAQLGYTATEQAAESPITRFLDEQVWVGRDDPEPPIDGVVWLSGRHLGDGWVRFESGWRCGRPEDAPDTWMHAYWPWEYVLRSAMPLRLYDDGGGR